MHGTTRPLSTLGSVASTSSSSSSSSSASSIFQRPQAAAVSVPQYKFACTLCNIPFARQDDLSDHYRKSLLHPQCDRCGLGARDAGTLADVGPQNSQHWPISYATLRSTHALSIKQQRVLSVPVCVSSRSTSTLIARRKVMRCVPLVIMTSVVEKI